MPTISIRRSSTRSKRPRASPASGRTRWPKPTTATTGCGTATRATTRPNWRRRHDPRSRFLARSRCLRPRTRQKTEGGEAVTRAIDLHVHPATQGYLDNAMSEFKEAAEKYCRTELRARTVDEMADEFRADDVMAVLLAWDARSGSGLPPVTNDFV